MHRLRFVLTLAALLLFAVLHAKPALAVYNCNAGNQGLNKPDFIEGDDAHNDTYALEVSGFHAAPWNTFTGELDVPYGQAPNCPGINSGYYNISFTMTLTALNGYPKASRKFPEGGKCFLSGQGSGSFRIGSNGELAGNGSVTLTPTGPAGAAECAPGVLSPAGNVVFAFSLGCATNPRNGVCYSNNADIALRKISGNNNTHPLMHGSAVSPQIPPLGS